MRRRAGELLPIEQAILAGGIELVAAGEPGFYGFAMARQIRDASAARQLTAHGTLYKALARLEQAGLITSSWEDPGLAEAERRATPAPVPGHAQRRAGGPAQHRAARRYRFAPGSRAGPGMTWLQAASARVVERWTRLYTTGLPAPVRDRRREEIGADVHGQLDEARSRRERPAMTAAAMMSRLVRGAWHDLSWRHEVSRPVSLARWSG